MKDTFSFSPWKPGTLQLHQLFKNIQKQVSVENTYATNTYWQNDIVIAIVDMIYNYKNVLKDESFPIEIRICNLRDILWKTSPEGRINSNLKLR